MGTEEVIAKIEIIPDGVDVDLSALEEACKGVLAKHGEVVGKEIKPMAFGMNALILMVVFKGGSGGLEPIEDELSKLESVSRAEVIDVRKLM